MIWHQVWSVAFESQVWSLVYLTLCPLRTLREGLTESPPFNSIYKSLSRTTSSVIILSSCVTWLLLRDNLVVQGFLFSRKWLLWTWRKEVTELGRKQTNALEEEETWRFVRDSCSWKRLYKKFLLWLDQRQEAEANDPQTRRWRRRTSLFDEIIIIEIRETSSSSMFNALLMTWAVDLLSDDLLSGRWAKPGKEETSWKLPHAVKTMVSSRVQDESPRRKLPHLHSPVKETSLVCTKQDYLFPGTWLFTPEGIL